MFMITLLQQEALVNEVIEKEKIKIEDMIFEIRGVQVILDSDLAYLYKCVNGTKDINKAVKRNIERFPNDFMFQLNDLEYNSLKNGRGQHTKYLPYVFTEQSIMDYINY